MGLHYRVCLLPLLLSLTYVLSPSPAMSVYLCPNGIFILSLVTRKVHLYPHPARLPPPNFQHLYPLGHLARFHAQRRRYRIYHRQRHPSIRPTRLPYWCPAGLHDDVPANGLHVALRQLEPGKGQSDSPVGADGLLECSCYTAWVFFDCCWDLWVCGGDY